MSSKVLYISALIMASLVAGQGGAVDMGDQAQQVWVQMRRSLVAGEGWGGGRILRVKILHRRILLLLQEPGAGRASSGAGTGLQ